MSKLSETLSSLIENKYSQLADRNPKESAVGYFSKKCDIDRPTLRKYLNGKRNLVNKKHLNNILDALQLTPQELQEVMQAYEITQIGDTIYNQRQEVRQILSTLSDVPATLNISKTELTKFHYPNHIHTLDGEFEIKQALFSLIQIAYENDSDLQILLQPEQDVLFSALLSAKSIASQASLTIQHIICLENNVTDGRIENLKRMKKILEFGIICPNYRPLYYYGSASEHFNPISTFPGLVVCNHAVLQLSADEKKAILSTDPELISFFQRHFTQLTTHCNPLMVHNYNYLFDSEWQDHYISNNSQVVYEICSGICSMPFLDRQLLQTYVNPNLPNYQEFVDTYAQYSQVLYEQKRQNHMMLFINPYYMINFIQTGNLYEYPEYIIDRPLSVPDRIKIIKRILQACKEGWYDIHLVDEKHFPIQSYWGVSVKQYVGVLLQHVFNNSISVFYFSEIGIVEAFSDYFEALSSASYTTDCENSILQIQAWVNAYLKK